MASGCGAIAVRLHADAAALLDAARALGRVKVVVRNDYAVLERPGLIEDVRPGKTGLDVRGSAFMLRLEPGAVGTAFALHETGRRGEKRSIQLFDARGISVAKLVLRPESDGTGFERLIADFRASDQSPGTGPAPRAPAPEQHRLSGTPAALAAFLHRAAALGVPLGISVANATAALQVETPIHRIKRSDHAPWINVLDEALDIHLFEARLGHMAVERRDPGSGSVHWLAENGFTAFSAEVARNFEEIAAAALGGQAE